jgi:nucleotide-binding universal stress UspA family protein
MIRKILVALDGSEAAGKALELALDATKAFAAELLAVHVVSDRPLTEGERGLAESEYQADVRQALKGSNLLTDSAVAQATAEGLMQTSRDVATLIHTTLGRRILSRAEEDARRGGIASIKTILRDGDPATETRNGEQGTTRPADHGQPGAGRNSRPSPGQRVAQGQPCGCLLCCHR